MDCGGLSHNKLLAPGEHLSYKRFESFRAVIARKEVRSASNAYEFPEDPVTGLSLAGGSVRPQQFAVGLGHLPVKREFRGRLGTALQAASVCP
jgi:hypothetical protein